MQLLDSEINRAINTSTDSSSSRSNRRNSNRVPLVITYHPNLPRLEKTIRRYHHTLQDSDRLRQAFPSLPIIAFRRPRNLRDLLVRAAISPNTSNPPGNFRCEARRCKTCPILVTTDTFASSVTGERFKLKLRASCKTSNVIYLIHAVQEVWSLICGRNRTTSPLSNEQPPFQYLPWSHRRISCGGPFYQRGPYRYRFIGNDHRQMLEGGYHLKKNQGE